MSNVRSADMKVIAVVCSDLHLSLIPPVARAEEQDWLNVTAKNLQQIRAAATKHNCPVLCAGDVFDHWKAPPELINFAFDHLPPMYAIPGQHDLPFHLLENINKSAYGTMVKAGIIKDLPPGRPVEINDFIVTGFPWDTELVPPDAPDSQNRLHVALVHAYTWIEGCGYKDAPKAQKAHGDKYTGYDIAVIGDNHISFETKRGGCLVWNCGGFMRRRGDESGHKPRIGLLLESGEIVTQYLETDGERFRATSDRIVAAAETFHELMQFLKASNTKTLDFVDALRRSMERDNIPENVRTVLTEAIEYAAKQ